jgi:PilZ domain
MQNSHLSDSLQPSNSTGNRDGLNDLATTTVTGELREVESPREADPRMPELNRVAARQRNRRRSTRREFQAIVRVYGRTLDGNAFYEDARTINVSVHGALLILNAPVSKGQNLLLFNEAAQRQQVCQIVDVRVRDTESAEVAVAFPSPHAEFWQVFPAGNRTNLHSKTNRTKGTKAAPQIS